MILHSRFFTVVMIYAIASFALWGCADGDKSGPPSSVVKHRTPMTEEQKAAVIQQSKTRDAADLAKKNAQGNNNASNSNGTPAPGTLPGNSTGMGNSSSGNTSSGNTSTGASGSESSDTPAPTELDRPTFISLKKDLSEADRSKALAEVYNESWKSKGLPEGDQKLNPQLKKDQTAKYFFWLVNGATKMDGQRVEKITSIADNKIIIESEVFLFKQSILKTSIELAQQSSEQIETPASRPDKFIKDFLYCRLKGQVNPEIPQLSEIGQYQFPNKKTIAAYRFVRKSSGVLECDGSNDAKAAEVKVDQIESFVYAPSALRIGFNQCGGALVESQKIIKEKSEKADAKILYSEKELNYQFSIKGATIQK